MTDFQKSNKIGRLLICLAALLLPILLCFCASGEESVTEIKSAVIKNDRNKVKIEATLSDEDFSEQKGSELCLVSLDSSSQTDGVAVVAKAKAKKKMSFTLTLDKLDDDFLSSALALATRTVDEITGKESFALITAPKYVENTAIVATKNNAPIESGEIKGFSGIDALDASAVGASNLLIEVNISEFMLPSYKTGAINYVFDGNSYYFDGEKLEALEPSFLRFPGGCVVEGNTIDLAYDWKDSIGVGKDGEPLLFNGTYGDVAARKQGQNIWTDERATNDSNPSYMSYGLGFYEYFLLAEDLNALAVPVVNCGMHCMAQGHGSEPDVADDEFKEYIQSALDLVEFCRGDASTKWGAIRIAMGHEEPFTLKYVGIGNENWGNEFFEKYTAFAEAFMKAKADNPEMYGDIELIYTSGPDDGDSGHVMYMDAYKYAKEQLDNGSFTDITDFAGLIDHHYYNDPQWFLEHSDYYDEENYSRDTDGMADSSYGGGIPVFLGEYAAKSNTMKAALAEAAYMTGLERNSDIVKLAAYAPLFGNITATHWAPDLIWFNNHTVTCSVNYYVQQIFARNVGTKLLSSELEGAQVSGRRKLEGQIGVGTWNTAAEFDNVRIVDNVSGAVLAEDDFSADTLGKWNKVSDGKWEIADGKLIQASSSTNTNLYATTGSAMYFGDKTWTNYTFTVDATKTGGSEGFLIPFSVGDKNNNWFWNIGGWNNTVSCLQNVSNGVKSDQVSGTVKNYKVKTGTTYKLKIVVSDYNVKCYIDDELMVDYDIPETSEAEAYHVVSADASGDIIIKLVNQKESAKTFAIDLQNVGVLADTADIEEVAGDSLAADNILGKTEVVTLKASSISGVSDKFNYTASPYSVTVIRIHKP